jgi:hypothetical protein
MLEKSKKGGKIPSFANSMGQSCWQSWAFLTSLATFANSFRPGCWQSWASPEARAGFANSFDRCCWQSCRSLCQPNFANSRSFPVGEGNGIRADGGVPPSPTVHMAVGEAFPTGPAFLLAKSSFPSLKTPTVLSQQELGSLVGKAFANRIGVFANSLVDRE